jgi:hypothetical protein
MSDGVRALTAATVERVIIAVLAAQQVVVVGCAMKGIWCRIGVYASRPCSAFCVHAPARPSTISHSRCWNCRTA